MERSESGHRRSACRELELDTSDSGPGPAGAAQSEAEFWRTQAGCRQWAGATGSQIPAGNSLPIHSSSPANHLLSNACRRLIGSGKRLLQRIKAIFDVFLEQKLPLNMAVVSAEPYAPFFSPLEPYVLQKHRSFS